MEENNKVKNEKSFAGLIFDVVSIIATAVIAVGICFTFLVRTIQVSGDSMFPTLKDKEQIVLKSVYNKPVNGDIVVTAQPNESPFIEDVLVKRVIATEGQTIKFERNADGKTYSVFVDDKKLDEPYINEPVEKLLNYWMPVTVPEGYVYVMGDNRNFSSDSRDNRIGMIREEYIMGKVVYKAAPFGPVK
ncbi:MAG: signal peptidase I [Clostridia bacterium]|nr:signal peptidase I [Clostridia bacterium]